MGRRPQPAIAEQLLERCTDHALEHGLPDRLEPLVSATGSSARMLLYHFGTRDDLLLAILRRARQRQLASFGELLCLRPDENYTTTLGRAWVATTGADAQSYLRMFGQLREQSERSLWPGFRRLATTDWLGPLQTGLASIGRSGSETLVLAVIRGLMMDIDATGDLARADAAFHELLCALEPEASPLPPR
ncbi:TetR/AcrR family transcriptional regulator [Planctomonas sp. JC2975]|uniref:TetR/AcrR family transcriptional regulator n=1 Tax=Planctomonas sp. JC2975 TaxID=2729626 RepID=UPI0014735412|nr:TetR/AcrR family transcriptional regulator [Planctomonas sp. JC2975]NNC12560.1 TetR/AcrR family transcriptional regulator [Planctomonas sp. JC2975]